MNVFHKFAIKSLKLNRTRTIVTIIGIILSTAMLTAVTTTVSSVQQFLLEVTEKQNGCWHGVVSNISMKQIDEISKKKEVENRYPFRILVMRNFRTVKMKPLRIYTLVV